MATTCGIENMSSVLSAVIAAIAVIVSAIITIRVTKAQIVSSRELLKEELASQSEATLLQTRANVISSNRQDWINNLRNEVAAFVSESVIASTMLSQNVRNFSSGLEFLQSILLRLQKVRLLINPGEDDHRQLVAAMQDVFSNLKKDDYDIADKNNRIIEVSQKILKEEWERVKLFT